MVIHIPPWLSYCAYTGIRLLNLNGQTDLQEASSISHRNDIIDIYSNSWGPSDTGFFVQKPGTLMQMALQEGVTNVSEDQWLTLQASYSYLYVSNNE